jgi:hypothetical protein
MFFTPYIAVNLPEATEYSEIMPQEWGSPASARLVPADVIAIFSDSRELIIGWVSLRR